MLVGAPPELVPLALDGRQPLRLFGRGLARPGPRVLRLVPQARRLDEGLGPQRVGVVLPLGRVALRRLQLALQLLYSRVPVLLRDPEGVAAAHEVAPQPLDRGLGRVPVVRGRLQRVGRARELRVLALRGPRLRGRLVARLAEGALVGPRRGRRSRTDVRELALERLDRLRGGRVVGVRVLERRAGRGQLALERGDAPLRVGGLGLVVAPGALELGRAPLCRVAVRVDLVRRRGREVDQVRLEALDVAGPRPHGLGERRLGAVPRRLLRGEGLRF